MFPNIRKITLLVSLLLMNLLYNGCYSVREIDIEKENLLKVSRLRQKKGK